MKSVKNSEGAVLVMIALLMVIFIGVTAFAIDFGIVFVANKQLQNAADAGALAGARALGYYRCVDSGNPDCIPVTGVVTTGSVSIAVNENAKKAVNSNSAFATEELQIADSDIVVGQWIPSKSEFTPLFDSNSNGEAVTEDMCNAVQATVRKEEGTGNNGTIQAFFGRIFNVNEYSTRKESIAAITAIGRVGPGQLVPIGIQAQACPAPEIRLQGGPENVGCVGWTNLSNDEHTNAKLMRELASGETTSPGAAVGDKIYFSGGVMSNVFNAFHYRWVNERDADGNWEVLMPAYTEEDCKNPNGTVKTITGFVTMNITYVDCVGGGGQYGPCEVGDENIIKGTMVCDRVEEGRGGGADLGTYGTIPGLVR